MKFYIPINDPINDHCSLLFVYSNDKLDVPKINYVKNSLLAPICKVYSILNRCVKHVISILHANSSIFILYNFSFVF